MRQNKETEKCWWGGVAFKIPSVFKEYGLRAKNNLSVQKRAYPYGSNQGLKIRIKVRVLLNKCSSC